MRRIAARGMGLATVAAVAAPGLLLCSMAVGGCASSSQKERSASTTPAEAAPPPAPAAAAVPPEKLDEIDQFFHRKAKQLQFSCYNAEVEKTNLKIEGNLTLSLMVVPGGKVDEVKVLNSSMNSPGIETCVLGEVKQWEWPDVPGPAPYTGSINFKPAW